jgi:hypothetical protein
VDPAIVAAGATIFVVWGDGDLIRCNHSLDAGNTWLTDHVQLNRVVSRGGGYSVAIDGGHVYVAWADSRNGLYDVFFRRLPDKGVPAREIVRLGTVPNPDALRPGQSEGPVVGCTWDPVVDHMTFLPGATLDLLWFGRPRDTWLSPYGSLLCDADIIVHGAAAQPFAIVFPSNPVFVGTAITAQAAAFDGVSALLTNALDLVVGSY